MAFTSHKSEAIQEVQCERFQYSVRYFFHWALSPALIMYFLNYFTLAFYKQKFNLFGDYELEVRQQSDQFTSNFEVQKEFSGNLEVK